MADSPAIASGLAPVSDGVGAGMASVGYGAGDRRWVCPIEDGALGSARPVMAGDKDGMSAGERRGGWRAIYHLVTSNGFHPVTHAHYGY